MHKPHVLSGGRYPVLRSLAIIYVLAGALAAAAAVIAAAYVLVATNFAWSDRAIMAMGALVGGFFLVISMLAIAEVLKLFIDVEHNTRMGTGGRIGMPASVTPELDRADGRTNRMDALDEETA
jgi:hypothetical protein